MTYAEGTRLAAGRRKPVEVVNDDTLIAMLLGLFAVCLLLGAPAIIRTLRLMRAGQRSLRRRANYRYPVCRTSLCRYSHGGMA